MPAHPIDLVPQWNGGFLGPRAKGFWSRLVHGIFQGLWKERNCCIYKCKRKGLGVVIDYILRKVVGWSMPLKEFKELSSSYLLRDWHTCIMLKLPNHEPTSTRWYPPLVAYGSWILMALLLITLGQWVLVVSFRIVLVTSSVSHDRWVLVILWKQRLLLY